MLGELGPCGGWGFDAAEEAGELAGGGEGGVLFAVESGEGFCVRIIWQPIGGSGKRFGRRTEAAGTMAAVVVFLAEVVQKMTG